MWSVITGDGFLGTEIDDKIARSLALGKNVVVTGWNCVFSFSIGALVLILTGGLVATKVTSEIGDG